MAPCLVQTRSHGAEAEADVGVVPPPSSQPARRRWELEQDHEASPGRGTEVAAQSVAAGGPLASPAASSPPRGAAARVPPSDSNWTPYSALSDPTSSATATSLDSGGSG